MDKNADKNMHKNINEVLEVMKKYGKVMASQPYDVGNAKMFLETEQGVFATKEGADMAKVTQADIEKLESGRLPVAIKGMKAMVYSKTPSCQQCLKQNKPFKACLDDMAQIVGHTAYIVDCRNGGASKSLTKALTSNVGCLVLTGTDEKGQNTGYTLTMGRNLYEAVVAMTVLEKSAEVTLLAEKIGGGRPIVKWEAKLMRFIYKKKYSKAEEKVKTAEVK